IEQRGKVRTTRRIQAKRLARWIRGRSRGRLETQSHDLELIPDRDVQEAVAEPGDAVLEPDVDLVEEVGPGESEQSGRDHRNHDERTLDEPDEPGGISGRALVSERTRQPLDIAVEGLSTDLAVLQSCQRAEHGRKVGLCKETCAVDEHGDD